MADLAALLDREATAEIEGILSEARERASAIVSEAEEEAEALLANRERAARAQRDAELVRARSSAQLEASSLTLRAQHAAIQDVFEEAERSIAETARGPGYDKVMAALIEEALAAGGFSRDQVDTVMVHPDEEAVARKVVEKAGLDATVVPDSGVRAGVRLKAGEHMVIENTLFGRLGSLRDELAGEVAQVLLSKEG